MQLFQTVAEVGAKRSVNPTLNCSLEIPLLTIVSLTLGLFLQEFTALDPQSININIEV